MHLRGAWEVYLYLLAVLTGCRTGPVNTKVPRFFNFYQAQLYNHFTFLVILVNRIFAAKALFYTVPFFLFGFGNGVFLHLLPKEN